MVNLLYLIQGDLMTVQEVNWSNISNTHQFVAAANEPNQWFWTTMLYLIFVVFFITLQVFGFAEAMLASAFIGLLLGTMLLYFGVVNIINVGVFLGLIVISILIIKYDKK